MLPRRLLPLALALAAAAAAVGCGGAENGEAPAPAPPDSRALDGYALVMEQRIHFKLAGEGDEVLILIHGYGGNAFSFRYQMVPLSAGRRVYAVDLLGWGYSDRPPGGDYSVAGQAQLVLGFMDALQIGRAAVAASSSGAAVALRLAVDEPDRITRLILIDPALGGGPRGSDPLGLLEGRAAPATSDVLEDVARWSLIASYEDDSLVTEEVVQGYVKPLKDAPLADVVAVLEKVARDNPDGFLSPDPAAVRQPTLLVWGLADAIVPVERAGEMAAVIADARTEVIEGAGHLPMEEKPDAVNRAILEFLETD